MSKDTLTIISWNINFVYNQWFKRRGELRSVLQDLASEADICLFQEDVIPLYKPPSISSGLFESPAFASFNCPYIERGAITRFVQDTFPVRAKVVLSTLNICVELLFKVACFIFSLCGDTLLNWYFKFPPFGFALILLFPYIFVLAYYFIGISCHIRTALHPTGFARFDPGHGRTLQSCRCDWNGRKLLLIHVHLSPNVPSRRLHEIKNIRRYIRILADKDDIIVVAGDFNSSPGSKEYKLMKRGGFRSCGPVGPDGHAHTFPACSPARCIDYVWVKGDGVVVEEAELLGGSICSDHLGLRVVLKQDDSS